MEGHNNSPYFTILLITKTKQENGFVSPFYKCDSIYTLTQLRTTSGNKDQVSTESDWSKKEYC